VLELGIALLPKQLMDTIPIRIEKDLKKVLWMQFGGGDVA
jgi:hypothetical protein